MFKTLIRNPFPTAIVGLGMFWLFKNSSEPFGEKRIADNRDPHPAPDKIMNHAEERVRHLKVNIQDHLSEWKDQALQQTQEWKEGAGQKMEEMKGYLQEYTHFAQGEVSHLLDHNPLAVGAVMVAMGAAVAAVLPPSKPEDHWLGDSRDKMLETVKTKVHSTVEEVKHKSEQVVQKTLQKDETDTKI